MVSGVPVIAIPKSYVLRGRMPAFCILGLRPTNTAKWSSVYHLEVDFLLTTFAIRRLPPLVSSAP